VQKRRVAAPVAYCNQHTRVFWSLYYERQNADKGSPRRWDNEVAFEIELIVVTRDPESSPSWFFLKEVGGIRRFGCETGEPSPGSALVFGFRRRQHLVRRAQRRHDASTLWRQRAAEIEKTLRLKTENKA
jgi:hypothetical protein